MGHLSKEEQETTISFTRLDDKAIVYTSDVRKIQKLDKLSEKSDTEWKLERVSTCNGEVVGKFYSCPVGCIYLRAKVLKREYSQEQKNEMKERLKKIRE